MIADNSPVDVRDLRAAPRYLFRTQLGGTFGPADVQICDMSECGIRITHGEAIRLGTSARLIFSATSATPRTALRGRIVWSHLSTGLDRSASNSYSSGLRIDDEDQAIASDLVSRLTQAGLAVADVDSLELKKKRLLEKQSRKRQASPSRHVFSNELSADQVMMINHARERLKHHPDEAKKWYMRARFAMAEDESRAHEAPMHYREDILAVWEYLERTVDLSTIVKVFEKQLR